MIGLPLIFIKKIDIRYKKLKKYFLIKIFITPFSAIKLPPVIGPNIVEGGASKKIKMFHKGR